MGWWSRWQHSKTPMRQRLRGGVDLLGQERRRFEPPRQLGLNLAPAGPAWSCQRLDVILEQLAKQPSSTLMLEARYEIGRAHV